LEPAVQFTVQRSGSARIYENEASPRSSQQIAAKGRDRTQLADIEVDGRPRQVLLTIGKPGIIWALDRHTGEFLWERETTHQTVYKHIDAETGQVAINDGLIPQKLDETFYGGKLWMASSYNPTLKTLFVPLNNLCMDYKAVAQESLPGEDYGRGRMVFRHAPNNDGKIGPVDAIGVENKQTKWSEQRHLYWSSSLLATAGGVVFGGDTNRRLIAFDGGSGKIL
jgi:glucose dehydrogenase